MIVEEDGVVGDGFVDNTIVFSWGSSRGNDGIGAIPQPGDELLNAWRWHFLYCPI